MILLYRLLFILYAEDRDLLPVRDERYDDYALREKVREDVRRRMDKGDVFSETAAPYWSAIDDLCRAIDQGDTSIGLPPYIAFCRSFFPWYNTEHRHAGIAMLTPDDVHHHRAPDVLAKRGRTLQAAWALHPERFVHGTRNPPRFPKPSGSTHPPLPQQEKRVSK